MGYFSRTAFWEGYGWVTGKYSLHEGLSQNLQGAKDPNTLPGTLI